ncbi:MAG: AMP-binding protein [Peptococcaceae bacterium]|nr:AMP-binding protein [Peptococcaceae bacterium]
MSGQFNLMNRVAVGDCLRRSARRYPQKIALVDGEKRITYAEFNSLANRFGHGLLSLGLDKGDKVAFIGLNCHEILIAFLGTAKAGMVFVPINPVLKPGEVRFALDHADVKVVVVEEAFVPAFGDVFRESGKLQQVVNVSRGAATEKGMLDYGLLLAANPPEEVEVVIGDRDPVQILYTGGTTSFPKAAVLNHLGLVMSCLTTALDFKFDRHARILAAMPLFHVAQLDALGLTLILVGGTIVIVPRIDPTVFLQTIEREKINVAVLLSPMFRAVLSHPDFKKYDLSSLRLVCYFGAVMPENLMREVMDKICPDLFLEFGQTEMSPCATTFKPEDQLRKPGSLGNAGTMVEIGVMADDGNLLPPGRCGEFVYRSPHVMEGYHRDPVANEAAFRYGWFHSGDTGYLDEEGYVYFVDRKKDVIKSGGENVASLEVEKVIYQDPRVREVQVIGLPHERWAEAVTAVVMANPGVVITEEEVTSLCRQNLAPFKVPKAVIFVEDFPRSAIGKTLKYQLRRQLQDYYQKQGR